MLHLLKDLVNRCKIAPALCVAHRWKTVSLDGIGLVVTPANRGDWLVCGNVQIGWYNLRQLKTLELEESTSDGLVVDGVKFSSLDLTKELVEGVVASLPCLVIVRGLRGCAIISYWAVSWVVACLRGRMIVLVGTVLRIRVVGRYSWCIIALGNLSTSEVGVVRAMIVAALCQASLGSSRGAVGLRGAHDDRVISMGFDMFLEILRPLEGFATELALVRLQRNVDANVGGDVIAFDGRCSTLTPSACQVQVVGRFSAYVSFADVFVESFWGLASLAAALPLALEVLACGIHLRLLRTGGSSCLQLLLRTLTLLKDLLRCRGCRSRGEA